jgi:pimeloyl-ACP methyl ester carboxylesterase
MAIDVRPSGAEGTSPRPDDSSIPRPFQLEVSDETLERIRERVGVYRWDVMPEPLNAGNWRHGPPVSFMRELCLYWKDGYDWRAQERLINAVPHYKAKVQGLDIHFVHERGSGVAPRPLLIAHGWPYSFHSYGPLVERLAHPERHGGRLEDAFSVVIPSYPGYDFSERPTMPMGPCAIALLFDDLMDILGYDRYVVHGGDWGAHVTSLLGLHRPERVAGIHSLGIALRDASAEQLTGNVASSASNEEKSFVASEMTMWSGEGAYSQIHATKPAKLAFAMMDSPVGVAAWIVEAFHAWSDRRDRPFSEIFTRDQLLTEIMLYLVTDAFATSIWIYGAKHSEEMTIPAGRRVEVPTGLSSFPDPVFPMPPRAVAEKSHNVVHYSTMGAGGHFPFYEAPDALIEEIRTFSRLL